MQQRAQNVKLRKEIRRHELIFVMRKGTTDPPPCFMPCFRIREDSSHIETVFGPVTCLTGMGAATTAAEKNSAMKNSP
jgi:hypothetical protein